MDLIFLSICVLYGISVLYFAQKNELNLCKNKKGSVPKHAALFRMRYLSAAMRANRTAMSLCDKVLSPSAIYAR